MHESDSNAEKLLSQDVAAGQHRFWTPRSHEFFFVEVGAHLTLQGHSKARHSIGWSASIVCRASHPPTVVWAERAYI